MLNRTDRGHVKNENFNSLFCIKKPVYTNVQQFCMFLYGEYTRVCVCVCVGGGGGGG